MALNVLSVADFRARSKITQFLAETNEVIQYWITLSESLLETFELDESRSGFAINMAFAVQKLAEALYLENEEEYLTGMHSPFKSEKYGSYSYTRFDRPKGMTMMMGMAGNFAILKDYIPPIVAGIINIYSALDRPISITNEIFTLDYDDYIAEYGKVGDYVNFA